MERAYIEGIEDRFRELVQEMEDKGLHPHFNIAGFVYDDYESAMVSSIYPAGGGDYMTTVSKFLLQLRDHSKEGYDKEMVPFLVSAGMTIPLEPIIILQGLHVYIKSMREELTYDNDEGVEEFMKVGELLTSTLKMVNNKLEDLVKDRNPN